jgi:hypothetical protein
MTDYGMPARLVSLRVHFTPDAVAVSERRVRFELRGDIDTFAPFYPDLNGAEQGEVTSTSA